MSRGTLRREEDEVIAVYMLGEVLNMLAVRDPTYDGSDSSYDRCIGAAAENLTFKLVRLVSGDLKND